MYAFFRLFSGVARIFCQLSESDEVIVFFPGSNFRRESYVRRHVCHTTVVVM